jgi:hypothetical protein
MQGAAGHEVHGPLRDAIATLSSAYSSSGALLEGVTAKHIDPAAIAPLTAYETERWETPRHTANVIYCL